jgi:hypothetical protein
LLVSSPFPFTEIVLSFEREVESWKVRREEYGSGKLRVTEVETGARCRWSTSVEAEAAGESEASTHRSIRHLLHWLHPRA